MKKLVAIVFLVPVLASAQTHTLPGTTNVPSGSTLNIQSGATINANAGSTVTGFGGGGTPGGSNTQLQYNNAGAFGGITNATSDGTTVTLTSPTFVTPALGTPSSGTLTNATGLPISTGVSGLASGMATFLGAASSANLRG